MNSSRLRHGRYVLTSLFVWCLACITPATAEEDVPDFPAGCSVLLRAPDGAILVESEGSFTSPWSVFQSYAVDLVLPKHMRQPPDTSGCPLPGHGEEPARLVDYALALRRADCTVKCPYPVMPDGDCYEGRFSNGNIVLVQVPAGTEVGTAEAQCEGERIDLTATTPLRLAQVQSEGNGFDVEPDKIHYFSWLGIADNASLVAYESKDAGLRQKALVQAADVVTRLLEAYKAANGMYPGQLCQLYTGEQAVVGLMPRNPYDFSKDLCETQYSTPRAEGFVRYYAEFTDPQAGATGYWLAIVAGDGNVEPVKPLPEGSAEPLRVLRWIEVHEKGQ